MEQKTLRETVRTWFFRPDVWGINSLSSLLPQVVEFVKEAKVTQPAHLGCERGRLVHDKAEMPWYPSSRGMIRDINDHCINLYQHLFQDTCTPGFVGKKHHLQHPGNRFQHLFEDPFQTIQNGGWYIDLVLNLKATKTWSGHSLEGQGLLPVPHADPEPSICRWFP